MIEIGKTKTVAVVKLVKGADGKRKRTPVVANGDPVTKVVPANTWRITRGTLDGAFGPDRNRKLVIGLINGDMLEIRPHGTRRPVRGNLVDIYRFLIRCEADRANLVKARKVKEARALRNAARRQQSAEKRLFARP